MRNKEPEINKNYISRLSKDEVYNGLCEYAEEFDSELYNIIKKYDVYTKNVLNIEREQKKPRKDYDSYSSIKSHIWYMYDELFYGSDMTYEYQKITNYDEINRILSLYVNKYFDISDKTIWFDKIKLLCDELGYAGNMKEYKDNPEKFKGNVADVSTVLRVALTTKCMTPDLYEIMRLLGRDRIYQRYGKIIDNKGKKC